MIGTRAEWDAARLELLKAEGYLMLETDDPDAAVELAARIPAARMGGAVEVRPVMDTSGR